MAIHHDDYKAMRGARWQLAKQHRSGRNTALSVAFFRHG